jgi:hypothetical protein
VLEFDPLNQDAMLHAGIIAARSAARMSQQYFRKYLALNPGNDKVRLKHRDGPGECGRPGGRTDAGRGGRFRAPRRAARCSSTPATSP